MALTDTEIPTLQTWQKALQAFRLPAAFIYSSSPARREAMALEVSFRKQGKANGLGEYPDFHWPRLGNTAPRRETAQLRI